MAEKALPCSDNASSFVESEMREDHDASQQLKPLDSKNRQPYSCLEKLWKPSIFLCIFVAALSTGLPYLLQNHPHFLNRGLVQLDHLFHSKWRSQNRASHSSETHGKFSRSVLWMAPFFSGGGYCSEAISYITALKATSSVSKLAIRHHGDAESIRFWKGLPLPTRQMLASLSSTPIDIADSVIICHSEPGAWHPPLYMTPPCPPTGYDSPLYVIGRTMFETDSVTPHHVDRCNKMDEVWVPSEFHVETFTLAGVVPEKLRKVVQPVDTVFFDPAMTEPMQLPSANSRLIFGSKLKEAPPNHPSPFVFLSIFKWEHRKGWDILLTSYLREFSATDNVALYLLTNPYHSHHDIPTLITEFASSRSIPSPPSGYPRVYLVDSHVPQSDLPGFYKAADCFVLPSRGEGWGRPHVEAMAMEVPVIATNWSGVTEYLTERNGYPLGVERMVEVAEGPFQGHLWAEPSGEALRVLMRRVVGDPDEARVKGRKGRVDMVEKYAEDVVGRIVMQELRSIQGKIDGSRTSANTAASSGR